MSIMDIINPWGALRLAKARIAELEEDATVWRSELGGMHILYREVRDHLDAAKALIANGHFRNPKTGRLGRKGVIYK